MTLLTILTTIVFCLEIDFIIIATTIVNITIAITIVNIIIDKFNFIITNIYFISVAINTCYIIFKFEKILKAKNRRSTESLNENFIYQKFNSYEIVKN